MKKILLLAFTVFSINSVFAQVQRTILVEEFTQASCPPCETTTPALNALMNANLDKVVQLRYQTSWPGTDPMNADNPSEVAARVDYYGVTGVPDLFFDGADNSIPASQANVDNAYSIATPVSMTIDHSLSTDLSEITATITITNEGTVPYNIPTNRLRVVVVEEDITWDAPPGSTSLTVFEAVMKTFLTGTAGMEIPEIAAGETWTHTFEDMRLPGMYDFAKVGVVAFIQNDANRNIAQSVHSEALELTGDYRDLTAINTSVVEGSLCDYEFSGSAQVINNSDAEATGYSVEMVINGESVQTKVFEETLASGATANVSFDEVILPAGTTTVRYIVVAHEGDTYSIDNFSAFARIGKVSGIAASIDKDYEDDEVFTTADGTILDVPFELLNFTVVSQALLGGNAPLGGFGESANSISVNFYNWNAPTIDANGSMTIADQYVAPDDLQLSFDYAYTSYQGSTDRLIVEVSTDCGATFDEVFNKAGSDLATAPEVNNPSGRFTPSATQWENAKFDLSSYAGETLLLRFRVVSSWGDMLYIDNITLGAPTDVNELDANESLSIFPNPASNLVNVQLTSPNATNVQLRIIDMLGRTVQSEKLGTVSGTVNHSVDVSALSNGSYLIFMNVDGKDVVKRLSVAH